MVTSIVGDGPDGGPTTTSETTTSSAARTTTTLPDFGESDQPITVPPTTPAPGPTAPAAEAAALAFLQAFWVPEARTSAQLADAVAPYATDRLLAVYRAPERADQAVPGSGVGELTVQAAEAGPTTATVIGRGVMVDEPDRRLVFRTLDLVLGEDGSWRVDAIR